MPSRSMRRCLIALYGAMALVFFTSGVHSLQAGSWGGAAFWANGVACAVASLVHHARARQ